MLKSVKPLSSWPDCCLQQSPRLVLFRWATALLSAASEDFTKENLLSKNPYLILSVTTRSPWFSRLFQSSTSAFTSTDHHGTCIAADVAGLFLDSSYKHVVPFKTFGHKEVYIVLCFKRLSKESGCLACRAGRNKKSSSFPCFSLYKLCSSTRH